MPATIEIKPKSKASTWVALDINNKILCEGTIPEIVTCTRTTRWQRFLALADTGADACLIPGGVTKILGSAVNSGVINPNGANGIGTNPMQTWKHNLSITLLTPDKINRAFDCPPLDIDCLESSDKPLLLGTIGFLENFKITYDYTSNPKSIIIEFTTP